MSLRSPASGSVSKQPDLSKNVTYQGSAEAFLGVGLPLPTKPEKRSKTAPHKQKQANPSDQAPHVRLQNQNRTQMNLDLTTLVE